MGLIEFSFAGLSRETAPSLTSLLCAAGRKLQSTGAALWEAITDAGRRFGIRPVGIETQRLLRLEKAHLIVGQDTDAMSHPYELGLEWALGKNKPFYLGQRALQVWAEKSPRRRLVGFRAPTSSTIREGDVSLEGERVLGRVTSCAVSPTLGHTIGLAYVDPARTQPGVSIVLSNSSHGPARAEVVATPFYDPDLARQKDAG